VISPTTRTTNNNNNNNNNNNSCEKELQKKAHQCFSPLLFTSHYIDISHELHINEQQIKEKVEK